MSTKGNNTSAKKAHVRDSFFDSGEKEFFTKLLKDPEERTLHSELLREDVEKLYKKACKLINRVEKGEFNEEQMIKVERIIAHCLAAIEDVELVKEYEFNL